MSENNGWIKCSERLPELYHTVFMALPQKRCCYMEYHITTAKKECEFLLDTW